MERSTTSAEGTAAWTMPWWAWLMGVALLLAWQGWLTQQLFGPVALENLLSDEPVVSGVHSEDQYLGWRSAQAVFEFGRTSSLDLNFQALYPITPIFDGARLAELFFLLGGGTYQPAAYKIGIACLCMLVPLLLIVACKAIGMGHVTTLLATFVGQIVWWGPHGENALQTGDCELYLGSLATLAHVGLLIDFDRTASIWSWFGLWITGCLAWFLQPLLLPIALPILLVYYLSVGVKHDFLTWHIAFWTAETIAFLLNLPWLTDWLDSWWLRTSLPTASGFLPHRTLCTLWNAPLWSGCTDRLLALVLMLGAGVGVLILNQTQQRPAARLLGMGAAGAMLLALLGISWEPLGAVGTGALLAPALWFACIPAAHSWVWLAEQLWRFGTLGRFALAFVLLNATAALVLFTDVPQHLLDRATSAKPLTIGLGAERRDLVLTLQQYTTDDVRILWEDRSRPRQASRWSALLPLLTGRQFIGGLDPDGFIEHSSISLMNQSLNGQPIATWSEDDFLAYCRLYNIRWIVAWSPAVIQKLEEWPAVEKCKPVADEGAGWLFQVRRESSFALKGKAELLHADGQYITLGNVEPVNGEVIVSLHYQAGMRASLDRVKVERAMSGNDPIGFVRLRLAVDAWRVTLSWDR